MRKTILAIALICTGVVAFLLLNLTGIFRPDSESYYSWFQRSGSILVVFSLWAEYEVYLAYQHGAEKALPYVKYAGVLVALLGTLIWGYGDLMAA